MMKARLATTVCALIAVGAWAQGQSPFDSFEDGVPDHWQVVGEGSLETSPLHAKHGAASLRWEWQPGGALRVTHGVGDIRRTGGYGGTYSKATFGIWIYCDAPHDGRLRFEFRKGDEAQAHFEFPLNYTGWRRAHLWYGRDFQGKVSPDTDNILVHPPDTAPGGTVFIDLVVYNGLLDYRQQYLSEGDVWRAADRDPTKFPLPEEVSAEELAGIQKIGASFDASLTGSGPVTEESLATIARRLPEFNVQRDADGIRGLGLVPDASYAREFVPDGVDSPAGIATLMLDIARLYRRATDPAQRERLADWYMDLQDHTSDQGMRPGNGFGWGWYSGRNLGDATFLMRDALRERGRLADARDYFDANYGFSGMFDDATVNPNMDHFHMNTRYQLYGALMQVTPEEQAQCLRAYSRRLSMEILHEGANGFKPDGSAFHHGMHYFAYASYTMNTLTWVLNSLGGTPYKVSPEALDRVKKTLLNMRFYCNLRDLPLSLNGRHPFSGQGVPTGAILSLAKCGSPDGQLTLDPDLASAYLRFKPGDAANEPFAQAGIAPEAHPQGNLSMNYAVLMAHRRDDWLATVRGYNRYFQATEIYSKNNRFGRYFGNGFLEILASGEPIGLAGSGCVHDGWDWNRLDGTTVIYLPLEKLKAVSSGTEFITSDETFCGGLSHRATNGVFVMKIHGHKRHDETFRARKSFFLFDDRIVCLGSDIKCADPDHPVQTNLFQKHLPETSEATVVNGVSLSVFPHEDALPETSDHWLMDTQSTGYYVPAGQSLRSARRHQQSRDQANANDTEGDFATAWLDHGTAPESAGYEYVVLVRSTPEAMDRFVRAMQSPETAPYEVIQKDSDAHIVLDRATGLTGYVLFGPQDVGHDLPVSRVDHPCLIMAEDHGEGLHLSLCDPDVNLVEGVSRPRVIRLTLRGEWCAGNLPGACRIVRAAAGETELEFTCHQGKSLDIKLDPVR